MFVESLRGRVERSEARPDFRRCCRVLPPKPLKHRGLVRQISRKDLRRGSWAPRRMSATKYIYYATSFCGGTLARGGEWGSPCPTFPEEPK